MTTIQIVITIVLITIVTVTIRTFPFMIFPGRKEPPAYIQYLGNVLPFAIIGMLVIYCFKSVSFIKSPFGLPEMIGFIYVVIIHRWKHNLLLSIGGGTFLYMFLIQTIFQ